METLRSRIALPFNSAMARSASDGVDRSTKAYPTGRVVRGLVGMDVDSLEGKSGQQSGLEMSPKEAKQNLHQVVLEEVLQLPLGGRICEVPNVKSSTLGCACNDSLVIGGRLFGGRIFVEGSVCQIGGNIIDCCGHIDLKF
jgi:hypothetical protein